MALDRNRSTVRRFFNPVRFGGPAAVWPSSSRRSLVRPLRCASPASVTRVWSNSNPSRLVSPARGFNPSSPTAVSVSLESELLERFDAYCEAGRFATRSEAIRQLFRERLTGAAWAADAADVAASLTLVYDHHKTRVTDTMLDLQHAHGDLVVATMHVHVHVHVHVHLDHALCLEPIALRGPAAKVQQLAAELGGLKGIHQAQLVVARAVEGHSVAVHSHG